MEAKQVEIAKVYAELLVLKKMMVKMQECLEDSTLTPEEMKNIALARKEFAEGKTTSFEDVKKELGL